MRVTGNIGIVCEGECAIGIVLRGIVIQNGTSEGQADGEMEGGVAIEIGIKQGIVVATVVVSRIDGLHTEVQTNDKIGKIEAHAQTIGHRNLLVEGVKTKLSTRLLVIVAKCPDVTSIDERRSIQFPEKMRTILEVHVQLYVARLVDKVDATVRATEFARTEATHAPTTHAICATAEIAFLERQNRAIAIGQRHAESKMQGYGVALVDAKTLGEIEVHLGILRIGNVEQRVLSLAVALAVHCRRKAIEQVARRLHRSTDNVSIRAVVRTL